MKRYSQFIFIVFLVSTGCTSHYYRFHDGSVSIFLEKPDAELVYFLSSLDGYTPHKANQVGTRRWQVTLPANTEFKYFYNVDGSVFLPSCELKENDDFGSQNCIYIPGM